jgi:hypothetical protein
MLRDSLDLLMEKAKNGPVGVQQWGRPVCLVLVSREWWDSYLVSIGKGDDRGIEKNGAGVRKE